MIEDRYLDSIQPYNPIIAETSSFALRNLDADLSTQQQKLYYWIIALVQKEENPEDEIEYSVSISDFAKAMGVKPNGLRRNMKETVSSMAEMNLKLMPYHESKDGDINVVFGIFQELTILAEDPNTISVRLNYAFRKKIIEMKRQHDIEYPTSTILGLKSKYSIRLYVYIIALLALRREQGDIPLNGQYVIEIFKDDMYKALSFTGEGKYFNASILKTMMKDLSDHSELVFDSNDPVIRKEGNKVISYKFHVSLHTSLDKPFYVKQVATGDIPPMEYLLGRLKEMGVAESLIKNIKLHNDRSRIWGNLLYTWYQQGQNARYFNSAYHDDYFANLATEHKYLFRLVMENKPLFLKDDEYINFLEQEYDKEGLSPAPSFMEELYRKIKARREKAI